MVNGNDYAQQGRRFLNQAFEELSRDDLRQASEKGWGAASQVIKAVADEREDEHKGHAQVVAFARALAAEQNDDELRKRFVAGAELHTNFYEGYYNRDDILERLEKVSLLVDQVERLLHGHAGPNGSK
jgi:hypothetical protein